MQKNSIIFITLSFLISPLFLNSAWAGDLEWSGVYRFEGNFIKNSELGGKGKELTYGLHHLVLRPKIVAGDGLTVFGQFDLLNDSTNYPDSQMGQVWGSGIGAATPSSTNDSNTMSERQKSESLLVTQLYLTHSQEYGSLIVGRAPLHFGLGITHNAGRGLFDHWYDTSDLVGYKFIVGNMFFMPMIGKPSEGSINNGSDDVRDYMVHFEYENPESDLSLGVFYQLRKGGDQASDAPTGNPLGGTGATSTGTINMRTVSVYALRNSENLHLGLEAAFQGGETGVMTNSDNVALGGFGLAAEFEYHAQESKWRWGLKAGTASGDDPGTNAKYEGFIFDRNYDVGMLMFNHPLGQTDFLGTNLLTGSVRDGDSNINRADVESIANVIYAVPSAKYSLSDKWTWENSLVMGWLNEQPIANKTIGKDLGYEYDISFNYSPRKGVMWVNQAGFLFPGSAWEGADGQYESKFGFGLATKAAISF